MSEALNPFRRAFAARPPHIADGPPSQYLLIPSPELDGHIEGSARAPLRFVTKAPESLEESEVNRYLWVIATDGSPYAYEACPFAASVDGGALKHTNLTGGEPAHCAGELWFIEERKVVINGDSGRYGPRSEPELIAAANAIRGCGYEVGMMAWNHMSRAPQKIVGGQEDLVWT